MNQDDYIILFDENGSPYIAHASWQGIKNTISNAASSAANAVKGVGRGVRQNHKYLLKVLENGKARYFYTQEEVKAYYNEKKKAANKAVEDATKKTKETLAKAKTDVSNKVQNGQAQYERMKNEFKTKAKETTKDMANKAQKTANSVADSTKETANKVVTKAKETASSAANTAKDMIDQAHKTATSASNTAKDMLDNARKTSNAAADSAKETASKVATKAKETASFAANTAKDMINRAKDAISPEAPKPVLSSPNNPIQRENIIEEKYIEEQRIPEKYIEEQRIPEKRIQEQRITEKRNVSYTKKPDPVNSSGARPYETMKRDAREAGVDFAAYDKAASDAEKLAKRLMKEYREANELPGPKSLASKMWYDDPEYKRAVEKRKTEEEKLVKQLYQ